MKKTLLILFSVIMPAIGIAQDKNLSEQDTDVYWVLREAEMQKYPENMQFRANKDSDIELGTLLEDLFGLNPTLLSELNIVYKNELKCIKSNNEIAKFDILSPIKLQDMKGNLRFDGDDYVLSVRYKHDDDIKSWKDKSMSNASGTIILHINNASGIYGKSVYKSVTVCYPPSLLEKGISNDRPWNDVGNRTISFLVAYDYQTKEDVRKNYYNILDSLQYKIETGNDSTLNMTERALIESEYPDIYNNLYLGEMVMKENRPYDAIGYLKVTFNALHQRLYMGENLNQELGAMYKYASFLIGYNYMELGLYEMAIRYLDFPGAEPTFDYLYVKEYINCLIAMKDFRAIYIIDSYIDDIEDRGMPSDETDAYLFFNRRKAYILVDQQKYSEAFYCLNKVLRIKPDDEFALSEKEYITNLIEE